MTKVEKVLIAIFILVIVGFLAWEFVPFDSLNRPVKEDTVVSDKTNDDKLENENTESSKTEVKDDDSSTLDEQTEDNSEAKEVAVDPDKADQDLIRSYYDNLASQKLEDAYKMKYDTKKVTFAQFKSWYGSVVLAEVSDIVKKADHKYQFSVYLREENNIEEHYLVTMEVKDGLLNTISSEKTGDNYTPEFRTELKGATRTLYLKKGGVEKVVATVDESQYKYIFDSYKFSDNNKYLMYTILGDGWGYRAIHVYDIDATKEVNLIFAPEDYNFTPDYKYFYQCSGMGESGGEFTVFSVPGFKQVYADKQGIVECKGYNKDLNSYFLVTGWNQNIPRQYDFATNTVK